MGQDMYAVQDVYAVQDMYALKLPTRVVAEKDGVEELLSMVSARRTGGPKKMIKGSLPFEWMRKTRR